MSVYLDSSALVKLYVPEQDSHAVSDYVRSLPEPLPFSHLHEIELKSGLRLKLFRREAGARVVRGAIAHIDSDLASGVLSRPRLNWPEVFGMAGELSKSNSAKTGCRSLDLLHIAAALLLQSSAFLTYDRRQKRLARRAGLHLAEMRFGSRAPG